MTISGTQWNHQANRNLFKSHNPLTYERKIL